MRNLNNIIKGALTLLFLFAITIVQAQRHTVCIVNDTVNRYLNEVNYTSIDDESQVQQYIPNQTYRRDYPLPVVINVPDRLQKYLEKGTLNMVYTEKGTMKNTLLRVNSSKVTIYNLVPNTVYDYYFVSGREILDSGEFYPEGPLRMIYAPSVLNVRDIGGWTTVDGRRIKYGKLIRGGELNGRHTVSKADLLMLRNLGIGAEIDMRAAHEQDYGVSAFGFQSGKTTDTFVPTFLSTIDSGQTPEHLKRYIYLYRWRQEMNFIVDNLRVGRTIYFHCIWGADRTGYLALFIEGLLGLDYDSMIKDYELTTFCGNPRAKSKIDPVIEYIQTLAGNTLQEKFRTFWIKKVGVSQSNIDYFVSEMLDGDSGGDTSIDETISPALSETDGATYDLQGRRVDEGAMRRGIYIRNGKKIVSSPYRY